MKQTKVIIGQGVIKKSEKKISGRKDTYKNRARIQIAGRTVEVDIEQLAKAIAVNQADWPAYIGKADRVAQALPEILKCAYIEKDLFN